VNTLVKKYLQAHTCKQFIVFATPSTLA